MDDYEKFKESWKDKKYLDGSYKCYVCGIQPAYYELGDERFYCAGCEKCARIKERFEQNQTKRININLKERKRNPLINYKNFHF